MNEKNQPLWGILVLAVVMFCVALLVGTKGSIYCYVWFMVGYYAYKAKLAEIQSFLKIVIYINAAAILFTIIFVDNGNQVLFLNGDKNTLVVGSLMLLAPKLLLYFYCKSRFSPANEPRFALSIDDSVYAHALQEIKDQKQVNGLWARCIAEAGGDEGRVQALYIKTRAEQLQAINVDNSQQLNKPLVSEDSSAEEETFLQALKRGDAETIGVVLGVGAIVWLIPFGGIFVLLGVKVW